MTAEAEVHLHYSMSLQLIATVVRIQPQIKDKYKKKRSLWPYTIMKGMQISIVAVAGNVVKRCDNGWTSDIFR